MSRNLLLVAILAVSACGDDLETVAPVELRQAVVVGGDYAGSGIVSVIDLDTLEVMQNAVAGVAGGDPVVRASDDHLFIINRFGGDNISILDRDLGFLGQVSTGAGSNPQDVAVIGDTAYVIALDVDGILAIDLKNLAAGFTRAFDLSSLDTDGVPDCNSLVAVEGRLYVSCSLFDRASFPWSARSNGVVAVLEPGQTSLLSTINLVHVNPLGWLQRGNDGAAEELLVSTVPDPFGDLTEGCLEGIDVADGSSLGCRVMNSALGGYAANYGVRGDEVVSVVIEGFTAGSLVSIDAAGDVTPWVEGETNFTDLALCGDGSVLVADNTVGARGVRVFAADGTERTTVPLDVAWPDVYAPTRSLTCW